MTANRKMELNDSSAIPDGGNKKSLSLEKNKQFKAQMANTSAIRQLHLQPTNLSFSISRNNKQFKAQMANTSAIRQHATLTTDQLIISYLQKKKKFTEISGKQAGDWAKSRKREKTE